MGRVEKMLLNFCLADWTVADSLTRGRLIGKRHAWSELPPPHAVVSPSIWRCFYMRHPVAMRECATWSRTVARLLAQFEVADAMAEIDRMLESVSATKGN